jgi:uncharacterized protein (TIGR02145 family)
MVSLIKYLSSGISLVLFIICLTNCESDTPTEIEADFTGQIGTAVDVDNNTYQTIGIGSQIWMARNLATLRLNDGTEISNIINDSIWVSNLKPAYCTYGDDSLNYKKLFGLLYNYYAVNSGILCPIGWRVPSYKDWNKLAQFVGGIEKAGGKLKQMDGSFWEDSNYGFEKTFNFNALPGGYRKMDLSLTRFEDRGSTGYWWTADSVNFNYSLGVIIKNSSITLSKNDFKKKSALSIRCIKK